jgi:hypothetical protein
MVIATAEPLRFEHRGAPHGREAGFGWLSGPDILSRPLQAPIV